MNYKRLIFILFFIIGLFSILSIKTFNNIYNVNIYGGCNDDSSPYIVNKNKHGKISYCDKKDQDIITIYTDYFEIQDNHLYVQMIGYPLDSDIRYFFEDKMEKRYNIPLTYNLHENWYNIKIDTSALVNKEVKFVLNDVSIKGSGWAGFSYISKVPNEIHRLAIYVESLIYIFLFSFLLFLIVSYFYVDDLIDAFTKSSIGIGIAGLIVFCLSLYSLLFVNTLAIILTLYLTVYVVFIKKTVNKIIIVFSIFVFAMMAIIVFIGFNGNDDLNNLQQVSAMRWRSLPIDNWIPKIFADQIQMHNIQRPMFSDWFSSDRPPLQTGIFILFSIFSKNDLAYLVFSIGLQLMVIALVFLFIIRFLNLHKIGVIAFFILIFFNGFSFSNSLFVWPKMLSALYQGISFYYVYLILINQKYETKYYILFGISSSLAFLSHGGSIFYLLALAFGLLFTLKNKQNVYSLLIGLLSSLIVYTPWIIYQKFIDPTNNRLIKWHLANDKSVTEDSFIDVIINKYQSLSLEDWIEIKVNQLEMNFTNIYSVISSLFEQSNYASIRTTSFLYMEYSFVFFSSFMLLAIFLIKNKLKNIETKKFIFLLMGIYIGYLIIWVLILMSPTVIHHSSYFGWFSGFLSIIVIVYYFNKLLFYILFALNTIFFFALYWFDNYFKVYIVNDSILLIMVAILFISINKLIEEYSNELK